MKITAAVILYQIVFGVIQYYAKKIGKKDGLVIAFILIMFWSMTQTYNKLFIFQIIIQSIIFIFFLKKASMDKDAESKQ